MYDFSSSISTVGCVERNSSVLPWDWIPSYVGLIYVNFGFGLSFAKDLLNSWSVEHSGCVWSWRCFVVLQSQGTHRPLQRDYGLMLALS